MSDEILDEELKKAIKKHKGLLSNLSYFLYHT